MRNLNQNLQFNELQVLIHICTTTTATIKHSLHVLKAEIMKKGPVKHWLCYHLTTKGCCCNTTQAEGQFFTLLRLPDCRMQVFLCSWNINKEMTWEAQNRGKSCLEM